MQFKLAKSGIPILFTHSFHYNMLIIWCRTLIREAQTRKAICNENRYRSIQVWFTSGTHRRQGRERFQVLICASHWEQKDSSAALQGMWERLSKRAGSQAWDVQHMVAARTMWRSDNLNILLAIAEKQRAQKKRSTPTKWSCCSIAFLGFWPQVGQPVFQPGQAWRDVNVGRSARLTISSMLPAAPGIETFGIFQAKESEHI